MNTSLALTLEKENHTFKGGTVKNFEKAVSLFENNISFSWHLNRNFYRFRNTLQNYFNDFIRKGNTPFPVVNSFTQAQDRLECINPLRYASKVVEIAKTVLFKSGIISEFGSLHIRRGDAIRECNTSTNHVRMYLECSLKACQLEMVDFPVIFFTDERSEQYINRIDELLMGLNHTMINGETLSKNVMQSSIDTGELPEKYDNNFFRFEVGGYIQNAARYQLAQRRTRQCTKCDPMCVDQSVPLYLYATGHDSTMTAKKQGSVKRQGSTRLENSSYSMLQ